ncbi:MAG TPA: ATP synthase F1 subunit delta [Polyangiaceae bacterium]|nr:ATP synthase F1 subunit delta [Polyangiaceae bacterium]
MSAAVARRYARAVFELAKEEGNLAEVTKELTAVAEAYEASTDFQALELTPGLTDEDRTAVVAAIAQQAGGGELTVRTLQLLAERQRLSVLPDLVELLGEMADDALGVVRAHVTSAQPLSDGYRARLKQKIEKATGKKVLCTFETDETLLAGIVTKIGDRVVDGSVRGKLNALAESLRQA